MTAIRKTQIRFGVSALSTAAAAGIASLAAGWHTVAWGLMLGAVFSVINFVLMGEALSAKMIRESGSRLLAPMTTLPGRYLMLAIPLVLAINFRLFDLPATIAGLFMVQLCILLSSLWNAGRQSSL